MQEVKRYLIEPVELKRIRSQLEYRLQLKENVKELQLPQSRDEEKGGTLFSRFKKLF